MRKRHDDRGYTIQNAAFNQKQTRKEWCKLWIDKFKAINPTSLDRSKKLERKIFDLIFIEKPGGAIENKFDILDPIELHFENERFSEEEIKTAQFLLNVMRKLLGKHTLKEIYVGSVFPIKGTLVFFAPPWSGDSGIREIRDVLKVGVNGIPAERALPLDIKKHILDRMLSQNELLIKNMRDEIEALLVLEEVPVELTAPRFKDSVSVMDKETYFKLLTDYHSRNFDYVESEIVDSSVGKISFFTKLVACLELEHLSEAELSYKISQLGKAIFLAAESRDIRSAIYQWLSTRGCYHLEIEYTGIKIKLDRSDYIGLFQKDVLSMLDGFTRITVDRSDLEKSFIQGLTINQELLEGLMTFLKTAAEELGEPILLYPFEIDNRGFRVTSSKYYKSFSAQFDGVFSEDDKKAYGVNWVVDGQTFDEAFVFDPSNPQLFIRMLPHFIALLLTDSYTFVMRTKGMPAEQCALIFDAIRTLNPEGLKYPPGYRKHHKTIENGLWYNNPGVAWLLKGVFKDLVKSKDFIAVINRRGVSINDQFSNKELIPLLEALIQKLTSEEF